MAIWAWALIDRLQNTAFKDGRGQTGDGPSSVRVSLSWHGFCNQTVGQDSKPGFCRNSVKMNMRGKNVNIYKGISLH